MPKFQTMEVWQQAESLMQPAFIRLVANFDKRLNESAWKGTYEDIQAWPEGTSEATKATVLHLRSQLENAPDDQQVEELERSLSQLPTPYPGYLLHLTKDDRQQDDRQLTVDLWNLCYQICFRNYDPVSGTSFQSEFGERLGEGVEIDRTLFDETGEVDWDQLDEKVRQIVNPIFDQE